MIESIFALSQLILAALLLLLLAFGVVCNFYIGRPIHALVILSILGCVGFIFRKALAEWREDRM